MFEIVNLYPECDYAYIMIGCNYRENLEYKKAIPYFEKAIEVNNIYTGLAYAELGFCYEMLGNLKKTEDCYKKSIEINPENPIAKYYWADYLTYKERDYDQAEPIAKSLVWTKDYRQGQRLTLQNRSRHSLILDYKTPHRQCNQAHKLRA